MPCKPRVRLFFGLALAVSLGSAPGQEVKVVASAPSQPAPPTETFRVTNIVPDFLAFWAAAESKDETTQIRMFRQMVIQPHPELFVENVVNLGQKQGVAEEDHRIAAYLKQIPPFIPAIRVLNDRLQADLKTYIPDFVRVFPDYRPSTPYTSLFRLAILMALPATLVVIMRCCLVWTSLQGTDLTQE